jgi:hypothetical protein
MIVVTDYCNDRLFEGFRLLIKTRQLGTGGAAPEFDQVRAAGIDCSPQWQPHGACVATKDIIRARASEGSCGKFIIGIALSALSFIVTPNGCRSGWKPAHCGG